MMMSEFERYGEAKRRTADSDSNSGREKDFFRADRLKTKTEKDYLMSLAVKPVMEQMVEEIEGQQDHLDIFVD